MSNNQHICSKFATQKSVFFSAEKADNATGIFFKELCLDKNDAKMMRGVVSSLIKKGILEADDVNGEPFFRGTDKAIDLVYNDSVLKLMH